MVLFSHHEMAHYWKWSKKRGGSVWTFEATVDGVAMAAASTALVRLSHHGTVTMAITWLRFPHEADITFSTAEGRHGWSMASEAVSSAQQEGNRYISYSQNHPPHPSPRLPLCPHMCEIKAIMTLHLTENAISLAKTFHLFEILVGTRCPRALVVVESPAWWQQDAAACTVGDDSWQKQRLSRRRLAYACEWLQAQKLVCEYPYSLDVWGRIR